MMKSIFPFLFLFMLACGPVMAEEMTKQDDGFEAPYFAAVPHPGFDDPGHAAEVADIEPAAGDEDATPNKDRTDDNAPAANQDREPSLDRD